MTSTLGGAGRRGGRRPPQGRDVQKSARERSFERRGGSGRRPGAERAGRSRGSARDRLTRRQPAGLPRRRAGVMRVVVLVLFVGLGVRLVAVQGFSGRHYATIANSEVTSTVKVPAQRGGIYDRNGAVLAVSLSRNDVIADPFLIKHPAGEAGELAPVLGVPEPQLQADLSEHSGFVYLAHRVDNAVASKVRGLHLVGITFQPDSQRVDPAGALVEPLLGTVGAEGAGQGGLEYEFNRLLAGHNGVFEEDKSPSGVVLPGTTRQLSPSQPGRGIELTLDQPLQYAAEQSLGAAITHSHAKSGIAIVMNTHTGDILAMANMVSAPGTGQVQEAGQNLAVTQVYEPGSVFKPVTFSAALAAGVITPRTVLTIPSSLMIGGWPFHDAENHGTEQLSATQVLAQSSNLGTIEIAQALGANRLSAQIKALGFGQRTGLGIPGESAGLVKPNPGNWSPSDIGSTPIGQDDGVTAQQVLDMINSVATGGISVRPRLVRAVVNGNDSVTAVPRAATHRVMPSHVAAELTTMMQQVVQDGTAVSAGVPGYTVAGKTGTAQIPDAVHGGYVSGAYMATFAGFVPAEHPALSAIVVLDHPTPIFGGTVAAPVFSQLMQYALHRYGVPTSPAGGTTGGSANPVPFPTATP